MRKFHLCLFAAASCLMIGSFAACSQVSRNPVVATVSPSFSTLQTQPVTPTPSPTNLPSPEPTKTAWELATPLPEPTKRATNAPLTKDDLLIVDKSWVEQIGSWDNSFYDENTEGYRYGLIDIAGNVMIPFSYFKIDELDLRSDPSAPINDKLFYFALEYEKVGGKEAINSGFLFRANGEKASLKRYNWVQLYHKNYLVCQQTTRGMCGMLDSDLHVVIPFEYLDMVVFDKWIAATKKLDDGTYWLYFLDPTGQEKGSLQVGGGKISYLDDGLVLAKGPNGKYGFVDDSMMWCAEPKWDGTVELDEMDPYYRLGYAMSLDDKNYYVNKYGEDVIPQAYQLFYVSWLGYLDGHNIYYGSQDEDTSQNIVFNDMGEILYKCEVGSSTTCSYIDGYIVDNDKIYELRKHRVVYQSTSLQSFDGSVVLDNGCAFDINGKQLSTLSNIDKWDKQLGFITCSYSSEDQFFDEIYTLEGQKLPLPEDAHINPISNQLFIVSFDETSGLCNCEGKWVVVPGEYTIDQYDWHIFEVYNEDDNTTKYGLFGNDGKIKFRATFDYISPIGKGYYEVYINGVHGIIDLDGNWIWYVSELDSLTD